MTARDLIAEVSEQIAADIRRSKLEAELEEHHEAVAYEREWNGASDTGRRYDSVYASCGCCSDGGRCAAYRAIEDEIAECEWEGDPE